MVLLHFKGPIEKVQFILEKQTTDEITSITSELCEMNNEFVLILTLLNNFQQALKDSEHEVKFEDEDLDEIRGVISEDRVKQRQPVTPADLRTARFKLLEIIGSSGVSFTRAVLPASSKGPSSSSSSASEPSAIPEQPSLDSIIKDDDSIMMPFLDEDDAAGGSDTSKIRGLFDKDKAQLWFGSRKLDRGKKLCDYKFIGRNEKSKLIVKMTKHRSSSMPIREGPIDGSEIRKNMMAMWHKKQERDKELKRDDDNSYVYSKWSDPTALRSELTGISYDSVRFR